MDDLHVIALCVLSSTILAGTALAIGCCVGCCRLIDAAYSV
uniref:p6 n=1 Tax=Barley yellow dwarf virus (isolate PAV) TaxID=2169986 RepID=B0FKM9_BYDVP|nr:P6 [Barley yellow dwarf virus PAV]ABY73599.1 P6 [Barley yellow dwarf virus PAV]